MDEAVEQSPLLARLGGGVADDDECPGHDLHMLGVAPKPLHPSSDIGIKRLRVGEIAAAGKDHLGSLGGELAPGVRRAGLDDDRPALDRPRDVQRAAHRQEFALVVEDVQPLGIEIDAVFDIADKGVLGPAVPQPGHDIEEFAGAPIALAMLHMLGHAEIEC